MNERQVLNVYLQGNVHYKTRMKVRLKQTLQTGQTGKVTHWAMSWVQIRMNRTTLKRITRTKTVQRCGTTMESKVGQLKWVRWANKQRIWTNLTRLFSIEQWRFYGYKGIGNLIGCHFSTTTDMLFRPECRKLICKQERAFDLKHGPRIHE